MSALELALQERQTEPMAELVEAARGAAEWRARAEYKALTRPGYQGSISQQRDRGEIRRAARVLQDEVQRYAQEVLQLAAAHENGLPEISPSVAVDR